ncbi:MAG: hypothetical protein ACJAWW_001239 [Sulfurimonas sp.]|jgi:hypothetical protein
MKIAIFMIIFVGFTVMTSLYIAEDDNTIDIELAKIKEPDLQPLEKLHNKFSKIDVNSKSLDLNKTIADIKEARELYPLDNILLRVDIELEHRKADEDFKLSK